MTRSPAPTDLFLYCDYCGYKFEGRKNNKCPNCGAITQ